jgi:hypothetical protein
MTTRFTGPVDLVNALLRLRVFSIKVLKSVLFYEIWLRVFWQKYNEVYTTQQTREVKNLSHHRQNIKIYVKSYRVPHCRVASQVDMSCVTDSEKRRCRCSHPLRGKKSTDFHTSNGAFYVPAAQKNTSHLLQISVVWCLVGKQSLTRVQAFRVATLCRLLNI